MHAPDETFIQRLERAMREGQLPDPRTMRGSLPYIMLGFAIGFFLGIH